MWPIIARIVIGFLLIIHGVAHWQITTGWGTKSSASSWLLPSMEPAAIATLGTTLWVAALLTFIVSGIVIFTGSEWWRTTAIISSLLSLLVIALFWQPNMVFGVAIDIGILVALSWVHWPSPQLLGA